MRTVTLAIGLASLLLSGCASIVSGQNQSLSVVAKNGADDVAGARCTLSNDKGQWFATTPGSVTVRRSYSAMAVDCKSDGAVGVASVKSSTKGMAFGNVLFGGLIGVGVDVATGAAYDYPDIITVMLSAIGAPSPAAPAEVQKQAVATPEGPRPVPVAARPADTPVPVVAAAPPVAAPAAVATPVAAPAVVALKGGQDSYLARKVAQDVQCHDTPAPVLVAKSAGIERYSVACKTGAAISVQCEFGTCRAVN
jgi:uncharacterized protein YceK